jgi:hypothetical protein
MNMIWVSAAVSWVPVPNGKKISKNLGNLGFVYFIGYRDTEGNARNKQEREENQRAN